MTKAETCRWFWSTAVSAALVSGGCTSSQATRCEDLCDVKAENIPDGSLLVPGDACLKVNEETVCIKKCKTDEDCDDRFFAGCKGESDDGSLHCSHKPRS